MQHVTRGLNKALDLLMEARNNLYKQQPDDLVDNPIAEAATAVDDAQEFVRVALEKITQYERSKAIPPGTYNARVSEVTLDEATNRLRLTFAVDGYEGQQFHTELQSVQEQMGGK